MDIRYVFNQNELQISICGELDENSAFAVRTTIDRVVSSHLNDGPISVVLDLSEISFMDSTGIGMLLGRYKKFAKRNVIISLKNPSRNADRILKMAGIYEIMPKVS